MEEKFINELKENDRANVSLLVTNLTKGTSSAGQPYVSISLQDRTGTIEAKKWDVNDSEIEILQIGTIVAFTVDVISYRDVLQLKVLALTKIDQKEIDYNRYALPCPVSQESLVKKLNSYLKSIKNEDIAKLTNALVEKHYDDFISYPAAVRNHHEFASGLLYHTMSMCDLGELLASYYDRVNRDILIAGIILHDIGKTTELSGPIATKYTLEGKLIGHISIMVSEIRAEAERLNIKGEIPVLLQHMVLSHHGEKEYGSPIPPLTREAFLLHEIDDIDAKMIIIDKALDSVNPGEFTGKVLPMDGRFFYKPTYTK